MVSHNSDADVYSGTTRDKEKTVLPKWVHYLLVCRIVDRCLWSVTFGEKLPSTITTCHFTIPRIIKSRKASSLCSGHVQYRSDQLIPLRCMKHPIESIVVLYSRVHFPIHAPDQSFWSNRPAHESMGQKDDGFCRPFIKKILLGVAGAYKSDEAT